MTKAHTYLTEFKGEVQLDPNTSEENIVKVQNVVSDAFSDLINLDTHDRIMYISGDFENTNDMVQKLCVKVQPIIVFENDEPVLIKAQGASPEDKWDIVIKPDGVFIQEYKFVKQDLIHFKPMT